MPPYVLPLEIAGLTLAICGLHALKGRLGLAPLYVVIGLLEAFLFVAGKTHADGGARIATEIFFANPANLSYTLFLPLLLMSVILVYVLEGTREARRVMVGIALLYVVHGVIDVILATHAANPPSGFPDLSHSVLVYYNHGSRFASLGSLLLDFVVIIVSYQFLVNRWRRLPLIVPLFCALVLAMVVDGVAYTLLRLRPIDTDDLWVFHKLQAGIAAGIPMAAYLAWQLRRQSEDVSDGIVVRNAFDIIDLRRRVEEFQLQLADQERQLAYLKDTFGRYVSNEVVQALLDDPEKLELGGEVREVTILFADIRGYSTLAESLAPTEVIGFLNRYFKAVTHVILENKGMINEFEGDAVLAVFGAPLDLPEHGELAVQSALGMLDAVRELNAEWEIDGTAARWRATGVDGLAIRIGLHSGEVVAGNIGSEVRTKYAVIGDTVNTASRVEGLNKTLKTSLLMTASTWAAVQGSALVVPPVVDMGTHAVKGRQEPVRVYTIENAYPGSPADEVPS